LSTPDTIENMQLNIVSLYYDLMNTYGDSGNLLTLTYRAKKRKIKVNLINFTLNSSLSILESSDLILMGGAEDRQQAIVAKDLVGNRAKLLIKQIQKGIPGLFICGAYQFLGNYYQAGDQKLFGLGVSSHYTVAKSSQPRLIGDIVTKVQHPQLLKHQLFQSKENQWLIGFENHGGRTYLTNSNHALGLVKLGFGNNGQDQTEGVVIKNTVGTYLHGPILPLNPALADYLIEKALEIKYNQNVLLDPLTDNLEQQNRTYLLTKLKINVK